MHELELPESLRINEGVEYLDSLQQVGVELPAHAGRTIRQEHRLNNLIDQKLLKRIYRHTYLNLGDEDLPGDLPDLGQVPGAHVQLLPDAERPAHHHVHQTRQTLG